MRLFALAAVILIGGSLPADAAWKEYVYKDLGVAKYFPAEPKREQGVWGNGIRLPLSKLVPDTILFVTDGGVDYRLTVVDFSSRAADGANIMAEAFSSLAAKGSVQSRGFPRIDLGSESVYGLALIVDETNGDHTSSAVFFNKGRLYVAQAIVPKGSDGRNNSGIGRFIETVSFHLEGYGWDPKLNRGYPIGDDDPYDRDLGDSGITP